MRRRRRCRRRCGTANIVQTSCAKTRAEGADEEQHRGDLHHRDAADLVGDPACGHRAGGRTEQRRRDGETEFGLPMPKSSSIGRDRAVDDRAVVAEQQAAEGRDRSDSDARAAGRNHRSRRLTRNHRRGRESCDVPSAALRDGGHIQSQTLRSGGAFSELRNQVGMNAPQVGDVEPGQRSHMASPAAAGHLDVVGHHQTPGIRRARPPRFR